MTIYYISPTGLDTNSGTTEGTPLLTFWKAIEICANSGDKICYLPGTHNQERKSLPALVGSNLTSHADLFYDRGKAVEIYAKKPAKTKIVDVSTGSGGNYNHVFTSINSDTILRNLDIQWRLFSGAGYGNAYFGCYADYSNARVFNCIFRLDQNVNYTTYPPQYDRLELASSRPKAQYTIYNCMFPEMGTAAIQASYTYGIKWKGCLFYRGFPAYGIYTSTSGLIAQTNINRIITADDFLFVADDCKNMGDDSSEMNNSDGTRNHVGIFGGPYGGLWSDIKFLISDGNTTYTFDGTTFIDILKSPSSLTYSDYETYNIDSTVLTKANIYPFFGNSAIIMKLMDPYKETLECAIQPIPQVVRPLNSINLSTTRIVKKIVPDETSEVLRLFSIDDGLTWLTHKTGFWTNVSIVGDDSDVSTIQLNGMTPSEVSAITETEWTEIFPIDELNKKIMLLFLLSGTNKSNKLTIFQDKYGYYQTIVPNNYTIQQYNSSIKVIFHVAIANEAKISYFE